MKKNAPDDRDEMELERLASRLRGLADADPGPDFAALVMDRIALAEPCAVPQSPFRRLVRWLVSPRTFSVSPLGGLAAAACLVLALAVSFGGGRVVDRGVPEGLAPVKFVLAAPGAREVAVIGSFNGWNAAGWTMSRDAVSGVWTLTTALPPGSHEYVFLIDGSTTVTDSAAALSADDGFGSRNSVLLVKYSDGSLL